MVGRVLRGLATHRVTADGSWPSQKRAVAGLCGGRQAWAWIVMDDIPKELELKLRVATEHIAALRNHPNFAAAFHRASHQKLVSVYFDSDERHLLECGLTLRVRQSDTTRIQTIKSTPRASCSFERSEWEDLVESDRPDLSKVQDAGLKAILSEDIWNSLKPVFETRIERTTCLLNGNETAIALSVDEGKIVGPRSIAPISEVELELKKGEPTELFRIARSINDIVPARLEIKSKSDRGYELLSDGPTEVAAAWNPTLDPAMPAGHAFRMIAHACLSHLIANEPALLSHRVEAVHQMRVALRRLRAAISIFSDIVSDDRTDAVKAELKWLSQEFGDARNLDAFLMEALRPLQRRHQDEPGLASVVRMFTRRRLKGHRRAQDATQSARFRNLLIETGEWIETGAWRNPQEPATGARLATPVEEYTAGLLSRRTKKIKRRAALMSELTFEQLHDLRIQIKKLRYASEFFVTAYPGRKAGRRFKKFRASLAELQASLGAINDIVTRRELCREVVAGPSPNLSAELNHHRSYAAGLIMGDQQAQMQTMLDQSRKTYRRFSRAKPFWKPLRRRSDAELPAAPTPDSRLVDGGASGETPRIGHDLRAAEQS